MLKALIVEDEFRNREVLRNLLTQYCDGVTIVGEAENTAQAISAMRTLQPDLVFMDVELGDGTAFDVLQNVGNLQSQLIFTTAYDHYAIRAIRFNALDYLLKPIDLDELRAAVDKARHSGPPDAQSVQHLIANLASARQQNPVITLSTSESFEYIAVRDIIRCEAQGAYTRFFIRNKSPLLVSKTLKEYEPLLQPYDFFRTHQSHLINMHDVSRFVKADGGYVELKDGAKIGVARTRREEFLAAMKDLRED